MEREKAKRDLFKDLEGLFQDGPEDAYSLRDGEDHPRLHDHVECEDECWYLHGGAKLPPGGRGNLR